MVDEKARQNEAPKVEENEGKEEVKTPISSLSLTQELLDLHLFSIREHFSAAGKKMELAILDQPIKVRDGGDVTLEVMGHMQEEIANKLKPELVSLIRQFTGANRVLITVEVKEEIDNGKPKLYTNSDKLNHLKKIHPALAEFQRIFGLEADF